MLFAGFAAFSLSIQGQAAPRPPRVDLMGSSRSNEVPLSALLDARVAACVDGDTIWVDIDAPPEGLAFSEAVRLLGVDTPETVHPRKPVERMGKEASAYTKKRLVGKKVKLAFDWDLRDRYGRLLAYVYLEDGTCFNAELLREGYAYAYLSYPFAFMEEFKALAAQARLEGKGLWVQP